MLLFGIESGSQKILNLMDKGTDTGTTRKILKICRNAGIWNHAFLFFGFPGEEKTDAEETINFLCNNREVINSVGCSTFLPGKHPRVCHEKQFASLIEICKDKEEDMAIWHDYQAKKGITPEEAINMRKKLKKKSQCLHPHQFILESICREHLLPLIDHGLTFKAAEKVPAVTKASTPFLSPTVGLKIVEEDVISLIDGISCIEGDEKRPRTLYVLSDVQHDIFMELSQTAFEILHLCNGENSVEHIAKNLSRKYDANYETVLKDSITFLKEMGSKGMIK